MDYEYLLNRDKSFINRYKLNRRSEEISKVISKFSPQKKLSLLDIGSADGYLLSFLNDRLNLEFSVGIEPCVDCIKAKSFKNITLLAAAGEALPFSDESFDAVVAASVIDHLKDVSEFLNETRRVLRKDGLLVITAIIPFYDKLANMFGVDKGLHPHIKTYTLSELKEILLLHDFKVILAKRFALPSFGLIPFERNIELVLEKLRLSYLMFYSIVVGKRL
ncbi:MAG: class I SAM-dependent methyltransferase [Candidatus Omnitrophica bacterium]|nr:class I SAM-dependent methyltransferase [Candidatus Omnitrophota bacterium]